MLYKIHKLLIYVALFVIVGCDSESEDEEIPKSAFESVLGVWALPQALVDEAREASEAIEDEIPIVENMYLVVQESLIGMYIYFGEGFEGFENCYTAVEGELFHDKDALFFFEIPREDVERAMSFALQLSEEPSDVPNEGDEELTGGEGSVQIFLEMTTENDDIMIRLDSLTAGPSRREFPDTAGNAIELGRAEGVGFSELDNKCEIPSSKIFSLF